MLKFRLFFRFFLILFVFTFVKSHFLKRINFIQFFLTNSYFSMLYSSEILFRKLYLTADNNCEICRNSYFRYQMCIHVHIDMDDGCIHLYPFRVGVLLFLCTLIIGKMYKDNMFYKCVCLSAHFCPFILSYFTLILTTPSFNKMCSLDFLPLSLF